MLETLPVDPVTLVAVSLVTTLVAVRLYAGSALLSLRFLRFWGLARRVFMPLLDKYGKRTVGIGAENRAMRIEFVGDIAATPEEIARGLQDATDSQYEVSVLSGLKTDWTGLMEVASVVTYAGDKPAPGLPEWLRDDQVHVFMFRLERGPERTRVCAHYEANSWRPDRWQDHLFKGETFDAAKGVRRVRAELVSQGLVFPGPGDSDAPDAVTGE